LDQGQRILEPEDVGAVGFAPTARGDDREPGAEGDQGQALEGAGGMTEEIDRDAIGMAGVLIHGENDDGALIQQIQDLVHRAAFGQRAKSGPPESPGHQGIQPTGFERPTQKVEQPAVLRELAQARHGGHLPVPEMPGQQQHTLALLVGADGRLDVLDPDPGRASLPGHEREPRHFDEEPDVMRIAGLGEPADLSFGHPFAKDPAQVAEHESPAEWNEMKTELAKPRDRGLKRIGPGHGGGADGVCVSVTRTPATRWRSSTA
jgi:hypothetical protein